MRDLRCDILADIKDGRIVSPKRIRQLIREDEAQIKGFSRFLDSDAHAKEAARKIAEINTEISALNAMLDASYDVIYSLTDAIYAATAGGEDVESLKNMKTEWEACAAGISSYWTRHIRPGAVDVSIPATGSEG
jgi:sulfur transfer complex TusBCD TusB component (DsrH family)